MCGVWPCGSVDKPAKNAKCATISMEWTGLNCSYAFCFGCYGDAYPRESVVADVDESETDSDGWSPGVLQTPVELTLADGKRKRNTHTFFLMHINPAGLLLCPTRGSC